MNEKIIREIIYQKGNETKQTFRQSFNPTIYCLLKALENIKKRRKNKINIFSF